MESLCTREPGLFAKLGQSLQSFALFERIAEFLKDGGNAAQVDVLAVEPPREGNPLLDLDLPNFLLTPHVAWSSREAMQALADQLMDNIDAFVGGEVRNRVV